MALALSFTGWASSAALVRARVRGIRGEPYIEAARALGASDGFIFRRHVLANLRRLLPVMAAFEMGGVLLLLAELGFLGFFLDGGLNRFVARGDSAGAWMVRTAGTPELGQLLSGGWQNFYQSPWMALWGGAAFFLAVLSFMLLGEGLKRRFETR
jgi:ABC-type dipeptide/oligopeptide/nickel transport system permease subunit